MEEKKWLLQLGKEGGNKGNKIEMSKLTSLTKYECLTFLVKLSRHLVAKHAHRACLKVDEYEVKS